MVRFLGSFFGLGLLPWAPGTWGTLGGVGLAYAIWQLAGSQAATQASLFGAAVLLTLVGAPLASAAERKAGRHDPGWFVVDEVAGYLLTMTGQVPTTLWKLGAAFVLFRIFDIAKIYPVRQLEKIPGGWGVMADDLAAGLQAWVLLYLLGPYLP